MIKNKFIHGLLIGLLLPLISFAVLYFFNSALIQSETVNFSFKTPTVALFSICSNLIPAIIANKNRYDEFIRGIMFPTVLGSFAWFIYFDPIQMFGS
jgi:hypothetical protein